MRFRPTSPVFRVCVPDSKGEMQFETYFEVQFSDDAQFKQAVSALYSSSAPFVEPEPMPRYDGSSWKSKRSSAFSELGESPQPPADSQIQELPRDPVLAQIHEDRIDALEILEGKKKSTPNRDYGNNRRLYEYWAWMEAFGQTLKRERAPVVPNAEPSATNPAFTWSTFQTILLSQMSPKDKAEFPELPKEELIPTLLFVDADGDVRSRAPLKGKSVKFFEEMMLDVMVRGWRDVLWLSRPGEEDKLPYNVSGEGLKVKWGEGMI